MDYILKLIELCEKESDKHYSVDFTIDKYGVQIRGHYYPEPYRTPTFNFSRWFPKNLIMDAAPGLDIYHYCKYEIDEFKKEVENGND